MAEEQEGGEVSERIKILYRLRDELSKKVDKARKAYDFDPQAEAAKAYFEAVRLLRDGKGLSESEKITGLIHKFERLRNVKKDYSKECERLVGLETELHALDWEIASRQMVEKR